MKKYLVKVVSIATEENPNFARQVSISYFGKDQKMLGNGGSHAEATYTEKPMYDTDIKEHGYNRECDAKKSYMYKNPENNKFWKSVVEIVKFEM